MLIIDPELIATQCYINIIVGVKDGQWTIENGHTLDTSCQHCQCMKIDFCTEGYDSQGVGS